MRLRSLILGLLMVGLLAGCGEEDTGDAEDAVRVRLEQLSRGEYGAAWQTLHPTHQTIVSEDAFVSCGRELQLQRDPAVDSISILDATRTNVDVPHIGETDVVTVDVEMRTGEESRRPSFDVIEVDSTWRWVLNEATLRAFSEGRCPS